MSIDGFGGCGILETGLIRMDLSYMHPLRRLRFDVLASQTPRAKNTQWPPRQVIAEYHGKDMDTLYTSTSTSTNIYSSKILTLHDQRIQEDRREYADRMI